MTRVWSGGLAGRFLRVSFASGMGADLASGGRELCQDAMFNSPNPVNRRPDTQPPIPDTQEIPQQRFQSY